MVGSEELLLRSGFDKFASSWSRGGRFLLYDSDESGEPEIYVMPFPAGAKQKISASGGQRPKWAGDGRELFYLAPDKKLMAAEINGQGTSVMVGSVRPLFDVHGYETGGYDVTADGQRFIVNLSVGQKTSAPITLVLNWTADVKR
jgi:hypothetical protein